MDAMTDLPDSQRLTKPTIAPTCLDCGKPMVAAHDDVGASWWECDPCEPEQATCSHTLNPGFHCDDCMPAVEPVQATEPTNPWPKGCPEHEAREQANAALRDQTTKAAPETPDEWHAWSRQQGINAERARIRRDVIDTFNGGRCRIQDLLAAIDGGPTHEH